MSSGPRSRIARWLAVPGLLAGVILSACATNDPSFDRSVERRATLERWNDCIERQSTAVSLSDVRARLELGCQGHRRDVLRTFPPRMESRVSDLLDERARNRLRERHEETDAPRDASDTPAPDATETNSAT